MVQPRDRVVIASDAPTSAGKQGTVLVVNEEVGYCVVVLDGVISAHPSDTINVEYVLETGDTSPMTLKQMQSIVYASDVFCRFFPEFRPLIDDGIYSAHEISPDNYLVQITVCKKSGLIKTIQYEVNPDTGSVEFKRII